MSVAWQYDNTGRPVLRVPVPAHVAGTGEVAQTFNVGLFCWLAFLAYGQIFRTTFMVRQRDRDAYTAVDAHNLINVFLVGLAAMTLAFAPELRRSLVKVWQSPLRWFLVYYALAGLTFAYSSSMVFSIYRSVEMVVNILLAGVLVHMVGSRDAARRVILWGALAGVLAMFLWRIKNYGVGVSGLKSNNYPVVAAMGMLFCLGLIQSGIATKRVFPKLLLPVFAFLWVAGTSSASMVSGVFGFAVMLMVSRRGAVNVPGIVALGIAAWFFTTFLADPMLAFLFPGKDLEDISGMTGRLGMWQGYLQGIIDRPLLGWGFPLGEKEYLREALDRASVMSAHNSMIAVAINTGLVGLFLVLVALLDTARWSLKGAALGSPEARVMIGVLACVVLNSMSYPIFGSHWFWTSTYFFAFVAYGAFYVWTPLSGEATRWGRISLRWVSAAGSNNATQPNTIGGS